MEQRVYGLTPNELATVLGGISVQGVYRILKQRNINTSAPNKRRLVPAEKVREILIERGFKYPKKNISIQKVKGGAGKTSFAFNIANRASHYGVRVLAIDFDQQGNLTRSFDVAPLDKHVWINIFRSEATASNSRIKINPFLDLIPSNLNNSRLDNEMTNSQKVNIKDLVNDILLPIRDEYDIVIMDCPPAINRVNAAATCGSNLVVIPINPDQYSMDGLQFSISDLNELKSSFKLNDFDYKIVWNKYDAREKVSSVYMHHLAKDDKLFAHLLPVVIRSDVTIKNVIIERTNVFDAKRKTSAREDFDQLTRELMGMNSWVDSLQERREAVV